MSRCILNIAFIFSLVLILNIPVTYGQSPYDFPDVHVFPSDDPQSEVHISINPTNPNNLILGCNTDTNGYSSMGYFYSTDGGNSWSGSENLQGYTELTGDPSTAFDADNHAYVSTLNATGYGIVMQMSNNDGITWNNISNPVNGATSVDKDMIVCDDDNSSPYHNNLYCGWTGASISSVPVLINRSINYGQSFSNLTTFNINGRGVNIQTAPNGHVYVVWASYTTPTSSPASGLGFSYSTDGGQTFSPPVTAFNYNGIASFGELPDPTFNYIRVNDYPSMAVDKSNGTYEGRIYVTYPEEVNNHAVVALRYSDNEGGKWSAPIILNSPNFRENFFPWISVDPTNGDIYVVYYAFDQSSGFSTNVYVAYSNNGGTSFQNIRVSDDPFTTAPINNTIFRPGYMGDYIGITAYDGEAWAAWIDNRNGTWQIYVSKVSTYDITGPNDICSSATYSVSRLPDNATVTWSTPANMSTFSTTSNPDNTGTVVNNNYYQATTTLTATINVPGLLPITATKSISAIADYLYGTINQPPCYNGETISNMTMYTDGEPNFIYDYCQTIVSLSADGPILCSLASGSPGSWYFDGINTLYLTLNGGPVSFYITSNGGGCTQRTIWFFPRSDSYVPPNYKIIPNPANNEITIVLNSDDNSVVSPKFGEVKVQVPRAGKVSFIKEVNIYNASGKLERIQRFSGDSNRIQMDISKLSDGVYFVEISDGKNAETQKLVITR